MKSIDNVTPRKMLKIMPDGLKTRGYVKLTAGESHVIDYIGYSVYPAKKKETGEPILRKDGTQCMSCTAYIGLDGKFYTTVRNDTVISQLVSETGDFPDTEGLYEYPGLDVMVSSVQIKVKMGDKEYPIIAFEPA